ncbi:MAG: aspartate carbamoyltransferase catalytic subunit [Coxiellaceae bacterium]|nr:aspartate carbamoyltransferase catalytic subunit [Coxiellaceae bacterium]
MFKKEAYVSLGHLLTINSLNQHQIIQLIERAKYFEQPGSASYLANATSKIITNLFFEPSTRTQYAFEIAAYKLHVKTITPNIPNLSTLKGESLLDTIHNLEVMGSSLFIIRHPINHTPEFIASELLSEAKVLNAGDGTHQHPSQCLTDLMTISYHFPDFEKLSVAIMGDTFHSRVAESLTAGLTTMGTTDIRYVCPPPLVPENPQLNSHVKLLSIEEGLDNVDIVVCLRVQKERIDSTNNIPDQAAYFKDFALTKDRLGLASPCAIVMHPGPINRGFEIDSEVADGDQSVILQQAQNSIPMRMAILEALLS